MITTTFAMICAAELLTINTISCIVLIMIYIKLNKAVKHLLTSADQIYQNKRLAKKNEAKNG